MMNSNLTYNKILEPDFPILDRPKNFPQDFYNTNCRVWQTLTDIDKNELFRFHEHLALGIAFSALIQIKLLDGKVFQRSLNGGGKEGGN